MTLQFMSHAVKLLSINTEMVQNDFVVNFIMKKLTYSRMKTTYSTMKITYSTMSVFAAAVGISQNEMGISQNI